MTEDHEALRVERGWPTPMHMHRVADALDALTLPARYGDVLRWVADLCDTSLNERLARMRACDACGTRYTPVRSSSMFCSSRCRYRIAQRRLRARRTADVEP